MLAQALAPDPLLDEGVQLRDDLPPQVHPRLVVVALVLLQHHLQGAVAILLQGRGLRHGDVDQGGGGRAAAHRGGRLQDHGLGQECWQRVALGRTHRCRSGADRLRMGRLEDLYFRELLKNDRRASA